MGIDQWALFSCPVIPDSVNEAKEDARPDAAEYTRSCVFPSLPLAIKWLRDGAQQNQLVRFRVRIKSTFFCGCCCRVLDFFELRPAFRTSAR